ncbi:hypothetical protein XELAEV_18003676mg [Xenopus laevis]|nr:hypothetical protein XELAEV_18003676mg [Xenopus laevis]
MNSNPFLLANLTLGYHIYDSCGDPRKAVRSVLQILSGTREPLPNYSCVGKRNIAGFIGDLTSETTVPIAQILTLYGYSQISYEATDPLLSDRTTFPYVFRTVQSDSGQYYALSKLLKHFSWTWIGIIRSDDESGEREVELLRRYLHGEHICMEFTLKINNNIGEDSQWLRGKDIIQKSSSRVIVLCGTISVTFVGKLDGLSEKTIVLSSNWGANDHTLSYAPDIFTGNLLFMQVYPFHTDSREMRDFLNNLTLFYYPDDKLIEDIWMIHLVCLSNNPHKNSLYEHTYLRTLHNCTGQERITDLGSFNDHSNSARVHLVGRFVSFDEKGELLTKFGVYNAVTETDTTADKQLIIHSNVIKWKGNNSDVCDWSVGQGISRAQCSDKCPPDSGRHQVSMLSSAVVIVSAAQRERSPIQLVQTLDCSYYSIYANCARCPDLQWPDENKSQCISRMETYLSYTNDWISVVFLSLSLLANKAAALRANNRSLSFLLLVSIKLSFLSVFLFLGRPVDITCMLRIITFGITFSIAVSSLLAKTIMVCVAFKATKPGSSWRKWVGVKLSNSVVLFCSSIQIIICMTWLAISPPFQELDLHTYPGTIIIQCNEGSAIGFYSVIGYMGLLAAVSFVLAFLARTLPDSFNEAKYITFSMLLFCSVWITMIPAYLSTKGKNTVCVEIFAILTSSAGLLFCIFLPKCYMILLRPDNNTKSNLLGWKHS